MTCHQVWMHTYSDTVVLMRSKCKLKKSVSSLVLFVRKRHWHLCSTEICESFQDGRNLHTIQQKTQCELKSMWLPACENVQLSKTMLNVIKLMKHFVPWTKYWLHFCSGMSHRYQYLEVVMRQRSAWRWPAQLRASRFHTIPTSRHRNRQK